MTLVQLHPMQLLYPTPFTLVQVQLLLAQLQLLLWRLQIHLFVTCLLLLQFPQLLAWIHPILLICCLVLYVLRLHSIFFSLMKRELCKSGVPLNLFLYPLPLYPHPMAPHCLLAKEQEKLSNHIRPCHSSKSNLCRGCLQAECPRKVRRTVRDIDRATHTLHNIDTAGRFNTSDDGFTYFLVGALRLSRLSSSTHRCSYFSRFCRSLFVHWTHGCLLRIASKRRLYHHWLLKSWRVNGFAAIVLVNLPLHTLSDFSPITRASTTPLPLVMTPNLMELLNVQLA